jgi:undecaprenyl pyrophosphate phosphatase UppP
LIGHGRELPQAGSLEGYMSQALRPRFWIEAILGFATGILAIVTLFWHDWLEAIFGVDPDKGNGSAERLIVIILLIVTLALGIGVRFEWRRARLAER